MKDRGRIKVIKKGTETVKTEDLRTEKYDSRRVSRDMVATVSGWVKEIKSRQKSEDETSMERFLRGGAQTSGA